MIKNILVPLDRSEMSEQALPIATALAAQTGALVTPAAVVVPDEYWSGDPDPIIWQQAEESAAIGAAVDGVGYQQQGDKRDEHTSGVAFAPWK